jgi:hypothetical protein
MPKNNQKKGRQHEQEERSNVTGSAISPCWATFSFITIYRRNKPMNTMQMQELIDACKDHNEVKIITCALSIAATAARERKQDVAVAIRHLVDAHQGRDQAEKVYREQRRIIATEIMAGLVANSGGPYQSNQRSGWGIVNCEYHQIAKEAISLADALIVANANEPLPYDDKESNTTRSTP